MYEYIGIIRRQKVHIDLGKQISDEIHELINVPTTLKFYMTSYLVYAAVAMRQFPGLSTKGSRHTVPVYKFFYQLELKESLHHFTRVTDAFFVPQLFSFDPTLEKKRVSDEAYKVVSKVGCILLQFPTFTYLKVGCYTGCAYMFPKYPSDKWILMELCRQLISFHKEWMKIHKLGFKFPLTIGRYTI